MRKILIVWFLAAACIMTVPLYGNLLKNPGFEDGDITGWGTMGEYELAVSDKQAHSGKYSVFCYKRTQYWQGPSQDFGSVLKEGNKYRISAWVRLDNADSSFMKVTIRQVDSGGTNYNGIVEGTAYKDRWTQLSGSFTPMITGDLKTLNLYVEGPAAGVSFYVDDVVVAPEVALYVKPLGDGRTGISLRAEGIDEKTPEIPANIRVLDMAGRELASGKSSIGSGLAFSLPAGFARVAVEIPDYNGQRLELERLIAVGQVKETVGQAVAKARRMQAQPKMAEYAGWIDYLTTQVDLGMEAGGEMLSSNTIRAVLSLDEWVTKIESDPNMFSKMRGLKEWAYLSKVDRTGQPFLIAIPQDYDHKRSYPLHIELHGRTLTHMHFTSFEKPEPDRMKLYPLGRSRAGGYSSLSEIDVLEAMDYVMKHWNIDADRVHLAGGSMGGFGTFSIVSRFPDLFASARPKCGGGGHVPIENALHVPFYSLHSKDDNVVAISHSRIPTRTLEKFGSDVIQDEADGVGHMIGRYEEGLARAKKWADGLVLRKNVDRVHYTAIDELARKAYWAEVLEWGPEGRPAEIDARVGSNNTLYLALDNVGTLKIDLTTCPAKKQKPLMVVINRHIEKTIQAPLPDALYIVAHKDGWLVTKDRPKSPQQRLHFPGGADALYHGEPIMVVWGTGGNKKTNKKMYEVAQISRQICWPGWPAPRELREGVPTEYTIYGRLPGKPDSEVTKEDMQKYNLFLIGTAKQNSVVKKLRDKLPVKMKGGKVRADDGLSWDCDDCAIGLLYYNPLAPKRLIYWVGSRSADFYKAETPLMKYLSGDMATPDFMVVHAKEDRLIAARRFDSRWAWEKGYTDSPLLTEKLCSQIGNNENIAKMIRQKTGADFAFYMTEYETGRPAYAPGQTRWMDVLTMWYYYRVVQMELSGQEIIDDMKSFDKARDAAIAEQKTVRELVKEKGQKQVGEPIRILRFFPEPIPENIEPQKLYSVAAFLWDIVGEGGYLVTTHKNPQSLRHFDVTMRDVLKQ
jgi:pimeloyl-ACP methyl ester carboxylesterase